MSNRQFALGVDYGTNSVRALIVDVENGREVATSVWEYKRGDQGVFTNHDPHLARQHPQDYFDGFFAVVEEALKIADAELGFSRDQIVGIGVDTTGSTPMPVDGALTPLACKTEFEDNLNAMAWLWKDHTSHVEAAAITELSRARQEPYLSKCGGTYSSEWFWSKIWRCSMVDPFVFDSAESWVEAQDLIPGWLCGVRSPQELRRGVCAAGHKAMYSQEWGGLPSEEFLTSLDPRLGRLRSRLYEIAVPSDQIAGHLTEEKSRQLGLPTGIPVAVGAFDAHLGAVGSGVQPGSMVKIMGTSCCDILVGDRDTPDIPGVCGIVPGSVIPGMLGIEAGTSAFGDLYAWWADRIVGRSQQELMSEASLLKPGATGLLALDWNNGNRTVLVDPRLSGLLVGQTLQTSAAEVYRAMIEATAFGSRKVIERIREYGVPVNEIIACGGVADKNPLVLQIHADVCGIPVRTSRSAQTCALGAAISGSVVGKSHPDFSSAIHSMTGTQVHVFHPHPNASSIYDQVFKLYEQLHDDFGLIDSRICNYNVMKELLRIREGVVGS